MSKLDQSSHQPETAENLPASLVAYLNGQDLEAKVDQAFVFSTVSEGGWPHAALLSVGEVIALDTHTLRLMLWPKSTSSRNLASHKKAALFLVVDKQLFEVRMSVAFAGETDSNLKVFDAKVIVTRMHQAAYAEILSGFTYRLLQPDDVLVRWRDQVNQLLNWHSKK